MSITTHAEFIPTDLRDGVAEPELIELSLLLPQWQVSALERAACQVGLTAGQMLRRVLADYCAGPLPTLARPTPA